MYVDFDMLDKAAQMAMNDDTLLAMMVEWNETQDWAMQDMITCKIMNYVKEKELEQLDEQEELEQDEDEQSVG